MTTTVLSMLLLLLLVVAGASGERQVQFTAAGSGGGGDGSGSFVGAGEATESTGSVAVGDLAHAQPSLAQAMRTDWLVDVGGGDDACSGVLIAPKFVLTSAKCAQQALVKRTSVRFRLASSESSKSASVQVQVAREKHKLATSKPKHEISPSAAAVERLAATVFGILELSEAAPVDPVELERHDEEALEGDDRHAQVVRASQNPGLSANQFVPVAAIADFINHRSVGHRWTGSPDNERNVPSSSGSKGDSADDLLPGHKEPGFLYDFPELGYVRVENESSAIFDPPAVLIAPRFALTRAKWLDESKLGRGASDQGGILLVSFQSEAIRVKKLIFESEFRLQGTGEEAAGDLVVLELELEATATDPSPILMTTLELDVISPSIEVVVLDATAATDDSQSVPDILRDVSLSAYPSTNAQASPELVCANLPRWELQSPVSTLNQGILRVNNTLVGFAANVSSGRSERYSTFAFTRLASKQTTEFLASATQSTVLLKRHGDVGSEESGEFPSFIATFVGPGTDPAPISCQGMLVAPKFVVTTASCVLSNSISEIVFQLADTRAIRVPYSQQMTILHPRYNSSASADERFDIAILSLDFATAVTPATLSLGGANHLSDELVGFEHVMPLESLGVSAGLVSPVPLRRSEKCAARGSSNEVLSARLQTLICLTPSPTPSYAPDLPSEGSSNGDSDNEREQDPDDGDSEVRLPFKKPRNFKHSQPPPPLPPSFVGSVIGKQLNNSKYSMVGFAITQEKTADKDADVYSISTVSDFAVFINAYVVGSSWEAGGLIVDGPMQISKRYIVGLRVSKTGQNFCGGSLIAPSYVLTAAHCVADGLANWVSVGSKTSSGEATEAIPIVKESIVIHKRYGTPTKFSFDAAIFELKAAAYADPVVLDQSPDFAGGERATMYGYGATAQSHSAGGTKETLSSEIRAVDLSLLSQAQCEETLPDIDKSMLCAVGKNGDDACKGDSGGPLVVPPDFQSNKSSSGRDVLVGFVSSGYECGLKNVPGVYMRVSSLTSFIADNSVGAAWSAAALPQPRQPSVVPTHSPSTPSSDSELRDLDDPTPRGSDISLSSNSNRSATPTTTMQLSGGNGDAPIRAVGLPTDLKPQVRHALLMFLLGISDSQFISSELLERLALESNEIRFFSSGDLTNFLDILRRHSEKPLYARRDRFGRQKFSPDALKRETSTDNRKSKSSGVSDTTVCTP